MGTETSLKRVGGETAEASTTRRPEPTSRGRRASAQSVGPGKSQAARRPRGFQSQHSPGSHGRLYINSPPLTLGNTTTTTKPQLAPEARGASPQSPDLPCWALIGLWEHVSLTERTVTPPRSPQGRGKATGRWYWPASSGLSQSEPADYWREASWRAAGALSRRRGEFGLGFRRLGAREEDHGCCSSK